MVGRTVHGDGNGDSHPADDTRKDNAPIPIQLETTSAFLQACGSKLPGVLRCTLRRITCAAAFFVAEVLYRQETLAMVAFPRIHPTCLFPLHPPLKKSKVEHPREGREGDRNYQHRIFRGGADKGMDQGFSSH